MRKVTTINLNNNAYQIDDTGFEALREYLAGAERNLAGNPDCAEIIADLEQAIGDKCRACLGPHKTVVSAEDMTRILQEMGPVEAPAAADTPPAGNAGTGAAGAANAHAAASLPRRRLYRLHEDRIWAGVCSGIGAYFGFDPVWVRVAFILLTIFTSGVWILVYIAMCFIVPNAETAEERAAARGEPFNAQELVDRLKKKPAEFHSRHAARRAARREARREARRWWSARMNPAVAPAPSPGYTARVTGGVLLPVVTALSAVWFAALAVVLVVVWNSYEYAGFGPWAPQIPRWVVIVAAIGVYAVLALPLGAARRACLYYANGGQPHGWADGWSGLLWIALVAVIFFLAWQYVPGAQEFVRGLLAGPQAANGWI